MPTVILSKNSEKDFEGLQKSDKKKVFKKLKSLITSPYFGKPLTGKLKGSFSIKAWPYRIIYEFNQKKSEIKIKKIEVEL